VDRWLPYLRAGAVYATGTTDVMASFTPAAGGGASTFDGGKNTHSHGYGISLGTEYAMDDNWSFKAEYTYVDLGHGDNTTTNCTGSAATCTAFDNVSLDNIHNNFTASMFRIGFNYRFGAPVEAAAMVAAPMAAPAAVAAAPVAVAAAPKDSDGDGVPDSADQCPNTPKGERVGPYGCSCDITRQVEFAFDSAELTAAGRATLDELTATLNRLKFVSGTVEGYTDNKGTTEYNQGLSERRAQTVADYLQAKGVASHRLAVKGMGESNPIADNSTEEGRAKNRRVVLRRTDCDAGR
jgi:outer membrane protein OmpA-like peptidoglycan-associated protein